MEKLKAFLKLILPPVAAFAVAGLSQEAFVENMANLAGIVFLVPVIAEAAKVQWDLKGKTWLWNIKVMKLITWVLSIGLVFVSWFIGWGFEGWEYLQLAGYGIGAGLVTNEYFTLATIKLLLHAVFKN